jgi:hypothetical protein
MDTQVFICCGAAPSSSFIVERTKANIALKSKQLPKNARVQH